jgi:hypothetical protein
VEGAGKVGSLVPRERRAHLSALCQDADMLTLHGLDGSAKPPSYRLAGLSNPGSLCGRILELS